MEVVKASTWEQPFYKRINAARALELASLYWVLMLQVKRAAPCGERIIPVLLIRAVLCCAVLCCAVLC
jgi:hypothetical protein